MCVSEKKKKKDFYKNEQNTKRKSIEPKGLLLILCDLILILGILYLIKMKA